MDGSSARAQAGGWAANPRREISPDTMAWGQLKSAQKHCVRKLSEFIVSGRNFDLKLVGSIV